MRGDAGSFGCILNSKDRRTSYGQIIKAAVARDFQIYRRSGARRKVTRGVIRWIEQAHPATAEIGEEVLAHITRGKLDRRGIVKAAAYDRAAGRATGAMTVREERTAEIWI